MTGGIGKHQWKFRMIYTGLLLASCVNVLWLLLYTVASDLSVHLIWIDCFSTQFWQGNLYPRWCFNANEGLGVPLFLFYFPLPYYIAALFHPLMGVGLTAYGLFTLLCFLATFLTAISCYSWLKDVVSPRHALLATLLFLFMPYRMEVMYFRVAYAEIWCMVWLPLVFKYTRRLAAGNEKAILPLAVALSLSLLSHGPTAIIVLLFGAGYVLVMTGRKWLPKRNYAVSVAWSMGLSSFYLVPAWYYHQFLAAGKLAEGMSGWANGYLALTALCFSGISYVLVTHAAEIRNAFVRREITAWSIMSLLVLCFLFPVSGPVYMPGPWRMQMIVVLGFTYMIAVWMQWLSGRYHSLWKAVYGLFVFVLLMISFALVDDDNSSTPDAPRMRASKVINVHEYRSQWIDPYYWSRIYIFLRHDRREDIPKTVMQSGQGDIEVKRWRWDGIELLTRSREAMTIRLDHHYFPTWQASMDREKILPLRPQAKTGQMLLEVPAGEHAVLLTHSITHAEPDLLVSQWASIVALLAVGSAILRPKRFDNRGTAC